MIEYCGCGKPCAGVVNGKALCVECTYKECSAFGHIAAERATRGDYLKMENWHQICRLRNSKTRMPLTPLVEHSRLGRMVAL